MHRAGQKKNSNKFQLVNNFCGRKRRKQKRLTKADAPKYCTATIAAHRDKAGTRISTSRRRFQRISVADAPLNKGAACTETVKPRAFGARLRYPPTGDPHAERPRTKTRHRAGKTPAFPRRPLTQTGAAIGTASRAAQNGFGHARGIRRPGSGIAAYPPASGGTGATAGGLGDAQQPASLTFCIWLQVVYSGAFP